MLSWGCVGGVEPRSALSSSFFIARQHHRFFSNAGRSDGLGSPRGAALERPGKSKGAVEPGSPLADKRACGSTWIERQPDAEAAAERRLTRGAGGMPLGLTRQ